jgi:hypothetical protein
MITEEIKNNPELFLALKTVAVNADLCSVVSDNIPANLFDDLMKSMKNLESLITMDKFGLAP